MQIKSRSSCNEYLPARANVPGSNHLHFSVVWFRPATILLLSLVALSFTSANVRAQSVLVWATGNLGGNTAGVANWLQASGQFTSVTPINSDVALSLATLQQYDRVLYFSNVSEFQNPTLIGNALADYADTGRRLVISTFSWANQGGNTLGGRIISQQLSPYVMNGSTLYSNANMQSNDGSPFFAGVNSVSGHFRDDVTVVPGAVSRGQWSDGRSLLATKGNVVGVNLFPDDFYGQIGGNYRQLFVNALSKNIPEPSTLLLAALAICPLACRRGRRREE